jgi:hypothetical protein
MAVGDNVTVLANNKTGPLTLIGLITIVSWASKEEIKSIGRVRAVAGPPVLLDIDYDYGRSNPLINRRIRIT